MPDGFGTSEREVLKCRKQGLSWDSTEEDKSNQDSGQALFAVKHQALSCFSQEPAPHPGQERGAMAPQILFFTILKRC